MAQPLGKDCKLYRNTGSYGTPTWTLIEGVGDLSLALEPDKIEATRRSSGGFKEWRSGLFEAGITGNIRWDRADTNFAALLAAAVARSNVEILCLDGVPTSGANQGLRAICQVFGLKRSEPLAGLSDTPIEFWPTPNTDAAPSWFTGTA